jgi:hypothetical protein
MRSRSERAPRRGGAARYARWLPLALACFPGCGAAPEPAAAGARDADVAPWFEEAELPARARAVAGWPDGTFYLPEIMGPGVGLLDRDGDGDLEILQIRVPPPGDATSPAPNRLWERRDDGSWTEIETGLEDAGFGQGLAVGDVDNDGDVDVFAANVGPDRLYINDGAGRFAARPDGPGDGDVWTSTATFCDYDRDGWLDLFVVHYVRVDYDGACRTNQGHDEYCGPQSYDGVPDRLWRNRGDGSFEDVSETAGLRYPDGGRRAKGLGAVCLDLTGDGWADVYVANDGEANQFWVNRGDGTFVDESLLRGVAVNRHGRAEASMGVSVGDVNGDGRLDVYLTHLALENNTLYMGADALPFRDGTAAAGMGGDDLLYTGFGCGLLDADLDGDLDLAVVNGQVRGVLEELPRDGPFWRRYAEPNLLFENGGDGRFRVSPARAGAFGRPVEVSRGLALGDLDDDGDVDLVTSNVDGSLRLFLGVAPSAGGGWVRVRASSGARDALGAIVTLVLDDGTRRVAPVLSGHGYQSSHDPRAHFGLGAHVAVAVEIRWPDGSSERFETPGVQGDLALVQGSGARL